nr:hypothetical protein [Paenibacillus herberti]
MDSFFAHIGDTVESEQRSSFMGKVVSFSEIGSITSPIIAGVFVNYISLTAAFHFNLALVSLAILIQLYMGYNLTRRTKKSRLPN